MSTTTTAVVAGSDLLGFAKAGAAFLTDDTEALSSWFLVSVVPALIFFTSFVQLVGSVAESQPYPPGADMKLRSSTIGASCNGLLRCANPHSSSFGTLR